eukprot:6529715-Prymnesium_polylepis.2
MSTAHPQCGLVRSRTRLGRHQCTLQMPPGHCEGLQGDHPLVQPRGGAGGGGKGGSGGSGGEGLCGEGGGDGGETREHAWHVKG